MVLLQLGSEARPAAAQPRQSGGPAASGRGAALAQQQAIAREQRELEAALAASARESGAHGAETVVPGRVAASVPFGGLAQQVVTGVAVPASSSGRSGGGVDAFNEEQMRRALEESSRAAAVAPAPIPAAAPSSARAGGMSYNEQMKKVMAESKKTALLDFERRAQELKVPSEPEDGAAGSAWIFFRIGDVTVKRRFWSDNSINNMLHFLQCHPQVFEVFGADDIQVVNMTCYPPSIIDLAMDGPRTLQACELWPSGQIAIQRQGEDPQHALPPAPDPAHI